MLVALSETVDRCEALVTHQQASTRPELGLADALSRLPAPGDGLPHIDLLHPCRRLFAGVLESCRLAEIERELLGVQWHGDPPSWMIPELYFAYVRRLGHRRPAPCFRAQPPRRRVPRGRARSPRRGGQGRGGTRRKSWLSVAGTRPEAANPRRGLCIGRPGLADADGEAGGQAVWHLARLTRREGDWSGAADVWRRELKRTTDQLRLVRGNEELAKDRPAPPARPCDGAGSYRARAGYPRRQR